MHQDSPVHLLHVEFKTVQCSNKVFGPPCLCQLLYQAKLLACCQCSSIFYVSLIDS